jgi:hypothetical protein
VTSFASDPDVAEAIEAAIAAGVARETIDAVLVAAADEPDDEFRPILLCGRLLALARTRRIRGSPAPLLAVSLDKKPSGH